MLHSSPSDSPKQLVFSLVVQDEQGNPLRLHPGLGDLPLHPEGDGWYSVLGSWNGATNNPNQANWASEGNLESNLAIAIPAINLSQNTRPGLMRVFCQYHKCSGNR